MKPKLSLLDLEVDLHRSKLGRSPYTCPTATATTATVPISAVFQLHGTRGTAT